MTLVLVAAGENTKNAADNKHFHALHHESDKNAKYLLFPQFLNKIEE